MAGAKDTETGHGQGREAPHPQLLHALEVIRTGAYVVDGQGRVVAVNTHAEELLGRRAADMAGQDAHELLHRGPHGEQLSATRCAMRLAFHAGQPAQGENDYFARADGSVLPINWFIAPYAVDGPDTHTLVLFHPREQGQSAGPHSELPAEPMSELERLALLAETTTQVTSTLNVDETLRRLVALVLPRLADWAVIDLITEHEEVWRTATILAGTLTDEELLDDTLEPERLLFRLFHSEGVAVDRARALSFGCRCSRARLSGILEGFSTDDLDHMSVDGDIVMTCEFCNYDFRFPRDKVHGSAA